MIAQIEDQGSQKERPYDVSFALTQVLIENVCAFLYKVCLGIKEVRSREQITESNICFFFFKICSRSQPMLKNQRYNSISSLMISKFYEDSPRLKYVIDSM